MVVNSKSPLGLPNYQLFSVDAARSRIAFRVHLQGTAASCLLFCNAEVFTVLVGDCCGG